MCTVNTWRGERTCLLACLRGCVSLLFLYLFFTLCFVCVCVCVCIGKEDGKEGTETYSSSSSSIITTTHTFLSQPFLSPHPFLCTLVNQRQHIMLPHPRKLPPFKNVITGTDAPRLLDNGEVSFANTFQGGEDAAFSYLACMFFGCVCRCMCG